MRYWYLSKSRLAGPLDIEELRKKPGFSSKSKVCPEDLAKDDAKNWKLAGDIEEFSFDNSAPTVEIRRLKESVKNSRESLLEFKQTAEDFINAQKTNMAHYQTLTQEFTKELQGALDKILSSLDKMASTPASHAATPPAPAPEQPAEAPDAAQSTSSGKQPEESKPPPDMPAKKAPKKTPLKVLVADDEEVVLYMYSLMLAEHHFEILKASSGGEALEMAEKHNPDIIFLDHNMPGLTGYEIIVRLRKQPKFRMTPICLVTGNDFDKNFRDWIKMEVQEFVAKPFTADDISNAVTKSLKFIEQNKRV